jgi:threonine/homoserine/homoserine lactone efflux protein
MEETLLASLFLFAAVATFTPGGATALAAASGMRHGLAGSVRLLCGLVTGLTTLAAAAAFGVGRLLSTRPTLETGLALLGSAYFLWLAIVILRSAPPDQGADAGAPLGFFTGLSLLWLNPKAWTMTLAAASAFGPLASRPLALAGVLGGVFLVCSALALTAWCVGGSWLARTLSTRRQWRALNGCLATLVLVSIVAIWIDFP